MIDLGAQADLDNLTVGAAAENDRPGCSQPFIDK